MFGLETGETADRFVEGMIKGAIYTVIAIMFLFFWWIIIPVMILRWILKRK
jgi:hypothetical protein